MKLSFKTFDVRFERGITLLEYVILGAAFIVIFLTAGIYLRKAGQYRANQSMEVGNEYVPCGTGALTGDQCL